MAEVPIYHRATGERLGLLDESQLRFFPNVTTTAPEAPATANSGTEPPPRKPRKGNKRTPVNITTTTDAPATGGDNNPKE